MTDSVRHRRRQELAERMYPELVVGGYTRTDGFVEFFLRVSSLVDSSSRVLDFGAGRGAWSIEDNPAVYQRLRDLRRYAARVDGVDVDPAVFENDTLDEARLIEPGGELPFADETYDLVVADYVLEHLDRDDASEVVAELTRVVKPGGWIAARTPNRWGLIAIAARLVPNRLHVAALKRLQPGRRAVDVFPTRYAMNTPRALRSQFPEPQWTLVVYGRPGAQQYAGSSILLWRVAGIVDRLMPERFAATLMVFVRKNPLG